MAWGLAATRCGGGVIVTNRVGVVVADVSPQEILRLCLHSETPVEHPIVVRALTELVEQLLIRVGELERRLGSDERVAEALARSVMREAARR